MPVDVTEEPVSALRQAALVLHSLGPADREWMMARLSPAQRDQITPLLRELGELGLCADRALLTDVLGSLQTSPITSPPSGDAEAQGLRSRLALAPATEIATILGLEPDGLIARVLVLSNWPWRDAVLLHIGPARERRVRELMAPRGEGEAVSLHDRSLMALLASRLKAPVPARAHGERSADRPRGLLQRLGLGARRPFQRGRAA